MYPFETDKREFFTHKSVEEVREFLERKIIKKKALQITSDAHFYGTVKSDFASFELGQFPFRNSWRPIIKLQWEKQDNTTRVVSKYSLDGFVYLVFSLLPLFGLYISIAQNIAMPFVITLIIYWILIFGVFQIIYMNSKERTTTLLNDLLSEL